MLFNFYHVHSVHVQFLISYSHCIHALLKIHHPQTYIYLFCVIIIVHNLDLQDINTGTNDVNNTSIPLSLQCSINLVTVQIIIA